MLTNNFAAAIKAREPLEEPQSINVIEAADLGAHGNAFAGGRANYDQEMYHAMHGAIMNEETGGNSSIANAGMRLAAKFGSAATKSDKDAEKSRAAYMQVMSQQLQNMRNDLEEALSGMRARQGELDEQLDALGQLRELVNDGNFDPTNQKHVALYNSAFDNDPEISAAEFALQTQSRQNDVIDHTQSDVQIRKAELEQDIEDTQARWRELEGIDPAFEDPELFNQRMEAFEEHTNAVVERWELGRDNDDVITPSAESVIASNFSF